MVGCGSGPPGSSFTQGYSISLQCTTAECMTPAHTDAIHRLGPSLLGSSHRTKTLNTRTRCPCTLRNHTTHTNTGTTVPGVTLRIPHVYPTYSPQTTFKGPCSSQITLRLGDLISARLTALSYRARFCCHRATSDSKAHMGL